MKLDFDIQPPKTEVLDLLQTKVDQKTKPIGALGRLEELAIKIGLIQQSLTPSLNKPHIVVFAGDHGIASEGVSAYPKEVTYQMVYNFLAGGAAINVFAKQNGIELTIVDAGVNYKFPEHDHLIDQKVNYGTCSFLDKEAMTSEELKLSLERGRDAVNRVHSEGCNIVGFGEMGIGNTSASSVMMSRLCNIPVELCVGRGTGVDGSALQRKIDILSRAVEKHQSATTPLQVLQTFGGYEIAQMCGAMLQAAENRMVLLVDGFIATASYLIAQELFPAVSHYAILCHQSHEAGHQRLIDYLNMKPLLHLDMRLGEGTGCAIAYPVIENAIAFLNDMASFEGASVSQKAIQ